MCLNLAWLLIDHSVNLCSIPHAYISCRKDRVWAENTWVPAWEKELASLCSISIIDELHIRLPPLILWYFPYPRSLSSPGDVPHLFTPVSCRFPLIFMALQSSLLSFPTPDPEPQILFLMLLPSILLPLMGILFPLLSEISQHLILNLHSFLHSPSLPPSASSDYFVPASKWDLMFFIWVFLHV